MQKFHDTQSKKNSIRVTLLGVNEIILNYIKLIYIVLLYFLKLALVRTLILLKKIISIKIKSKIKKFLFHNNKLFNFAVFFEKWVKSSPSINEIKLINSIIFYFISIIFVPLFIFIVKQEKWKILMLEKLKNNPEFKVVFEKFTMNTKLPVDENIYCKINTLDKLSKSELEIFEKLNRALFLKRLNNI